MIRLLKLTLVVVLCAVVYGAISGNIDIKGVCMILGLIAVIAFIVWAFVAEHKADNKEKEKVALMSPDERKAYLTNKAVQQAELQASSDYGSISFYILCPHCQTKGKVRTKQIKQKVGVSGAKATGAILTGGVSLLATGLSRKQQVTQARCGKCGSSWQF
jgi:hypothetical protein